MDLIPNPAGVRFLTGLLILGAVFMVILPYFRKPEDFFIKRFRPKNHDEYTHAQLLFRAYIGAGLIGSSIFALGWSIAFQMPLWMWAAIALFGASASGTVTYMYFRLWRYRKPTPCELRSGADMRRDAFMLGRHPGNVQKNLRLTLLLVLAGLIVFSALTIILGSLGYL